MKGIIIRLISNQYQVLLENAQVVDCVAMGKLRLGATPLAGDSVEVANNNGRYCIEKIYERRNFLKRPPIANVDQALIVMSAVEPDFSSTLVDQLIMLISAAKIEPILLITKTDLVKDNRLEEIIADYKLGGYKVLTSGKMNTEEESLALAEVLKGKVTVLAGQSGVGKSSLLNKLAPDFQLQTQEISKALGRGKHTTRHVELHKVAEGYVADTPGFSKLDFSHISKEELAEVVPDFRKYLGTCRFRDCLHQHEPDCAIKNAVENKEISKIRYQHYLNILQEILERKEKYD